MGKTYGRGKFRYEVLRDTLDCKKGDFLRYADPRDARSGVQAGVLRAAFSAQAQRYAWENGIQR